MSDATLTVSEVDLTWSAKSGKVHKFNAKLNGLLVRGIKFFPEKGNVQPPGETYIDRKTRKEEFWRHVVLDKEDRELVAKKFKSFLKKANDTDEDDD